MTTGDPAPTMTALLDRLAAGGGEPPGAAALLGHADPAELARFTFLEDALWRVTTLRPAELEAVRVRCARIRGCAYCASVRMRAALDDGLSEDELALVDDEDARAVLTERQQCALALVDLSLVRLEQPSPEQRRRFLDALGARGIVEALLAGATFGSAKLRVALGRNAPPDVPVVGEPVHAGPAPASGGAWPTVDEVAVLTGGGLPHVDATIAEALRDLRKKLWAQRDAPPETMAAAAVRCGQLLGSSPRWHDDPELPGPLSAAPDPAIVRHWPDGPGLGPLDRALLAYAEQFWLDAELLDPACTGALADELGTAALVRLTWWFLWIEQLLRLAVVLAPGSTRGGSP